MLVLEPVLFVSSCSESPLLYHGVQACSTQSLISDSWYLISCGNSWSTAVKFVQFGRYGSVLILQIAIEFDQQHFLKMLSFPNAYFWLLCQKSCVHRCVDLHVGLQFDFIDQYIYFYDNAVLFLLH